MQAVGLWAQAMQIRLTAWVETQRLAASYFCQAKFLCVVCSYACHVDLNAAENGSCGAACA